MMYQESEVHGLLLAIVVCYKHDRLDMLHQVAHAQHASNETESVILPTLHDSILSVIMQHEMRQNHFGMHQCTNIELFGEYLFE